MLGRPCQTDRHRATPAASPRGRGGRARRVCGRVSALNRRSALEPARASTRLPAYSFCFFKPIFLCFVRYCCCSFNPALSTLSSSSWRRWWWPLPCSGRMLVGWLTHAHESAHAKGLLESHLGFDCSIYLTLPIQPLL